MYTYKVQLYRVPADYYIVNMSPNGLPLHAVILHACKIRLYAAHTYSRVVHDIPDHWAVQEHVFGAEQVPPLLHVCAQTAK